MDVFFGLWPRWIYSHAFVNSLNTLILLAALLVVRVVTLRAVASSRATSPETKRRLIVGTRNAAVVIFLVGIGLIWSTEIKMLAISVVAFAAALAIGLKEAFLNVAGALYRSSLSSLDITQRVTIDGYRGDVIDHDIMGTTIQEVSSDSGYHHYTGRTIVIPNSMFLTRPFAVRLNKDGFQLHTVSVKIPADSDWRRKERCLIEAVQEVVDPYYGNARESLTKSLSRDGLEIPSLEPAVFVNHPEPATIELQVRFPLPIDRRNRIHQAVLQGYLDRAFAPMPTS